MLEDDNGAIEECANEEDILSNSNKENAAAQQSQPKQKIKKKLIQNQTMTSGFGLEKSRDVKSRQVHSRSANRKGTVQDNNPKNLRSTEETGEWAENTEHGIVTEVQNDYRVKKHLMEEVNEKMSLLFYDFNSSQR